MKKVFVVAVIAGAIRLASATSPAFTAVAIGLLGVAAAGYGLWSNGRAHWAGWRRSWGLLTFGLAGTAIGAVLAAGRPEGLGTGTGAALAVTAVADLAAIAGLVVIIHQRQAGQWAESLATAVVGVCSLAFPLLSLVVVPALGWHPGHQLLPIAVPALDLVMLWLGMSLVALSERHPVAYRYLVAAFACVFIAHASGAALYLDGQRSSAVPLSSILLFGICLWGGAVLHGSQRQALDPVPFRSTRPGWSQMALMLVGALVAPLVICVKAMLHMPFSLTLLTAGSSGVPVLIVAYLLYQVFARSAAEYRAQHDPLTGVCNRVLFDDRLESALTESRRSGDALALMFLDLDRFKSINDSLGHAVGNQLLQAVVKRLQGRLRPKDTLARMGGDEFTILFPEMGGPDRTGILAERILGAFAEPFNLGGKLLAVQASLGIALYPGDGEDAETLFKNADTAMYQAKASGRNTYAVYDSSMSARAELRFALETSLRSSLELGRLTVHYQPKLSTDDGRVTGVEALARWEHPQLGFIPPSAFIPLAEETSLIANLGEWVLETACLQARAWHQQGLAALPVAVNISPRQFERQSVVRMVADVLGRTGLDPSLLELEVTESVLVEHMENTAASLAELRAMGVRCSIDDFGTGYSALTYLAEMPVDAVKIDPSFVRRIDAENGAAPIVGAVVALAHSLNLQVVAEGVETLAQLEFLTRHGCDQVQGFLFSPPVPADRIPALVSDPERLVSGRDDHPAPGGHRARLLPPSRLDAVLAGVADGRSWATELDNEDFLAVLAALEPDDLVVISGPKGSRVFPARMAVGTLAGLASVTGTLSATGLLPPA